MDYKFTHEFKDREGNVTSVIEHTFDACSADDIVEQFADFLRGCGFHENIIKEYINLK